MDTLARVKALIGDLANLPAEMITDDGPLGAEGAGLDSLDLIQLGLDVGEHFGITIPADDLDKPEMGSAAGIARYVDGRIAEDALWSRVDAHQVASGWPAHLDRDEHAQLSERLTKLREFIKENPAFKVLPEHDRGLLHSQESYMSAYLLTLTARLERAGVTNG